MDTVLSTKVDKYKLQQEEAALKVKLAFVEQEKAVKLEREVNAGTKTGRAQTEDGA